MGLLQGRLINEAPSSYVHFIFSSLPHPMLCALVSGSLFFLPSQKSFVVNAVVSCVKALSSSGVTDGRVAWTCSNSGFHFCDLHVAASGNDFPALAYALILTR